MAEEAAHILLADISGYTRFINADTVTLRHATFVVSTLLEVLVKAAKQPVAAHKIEGDAVLFIGLGSASGDAAEAASRSISALFQAFYACRAKLAAANTCPCEACVGVGKLDLKIIAHHGPLIRHKVGRFEEVSGVSLVVAHRLAKNGVDATRYLLATETAWEHIKPAGEVAVERRIEDCEGIGAVAVVVVRDLPAAAATGTALPAGMPTKAIDWAMKHVVLLPILGPWLIRRVAAAPHDLCAVPE